MAGALSLGLCLAANAAGSPAAAEEQKAPAETAERARILSVTSETTPAGTRVFIAGNRPLSYTSYDPDQTTLVIEIPGVDSRGVQPTMNVNTPQLDTIQINHFETAKGTPNARLEFTGRRAATTRIEPQGDGLVVYFEGTTQPSGNEDQAPAQQEQAQAAEPPAAAATAAPTANPATMLSAMDISGADETPVVSFAGDGTLAYESFELESPDRLVVDFQGVRNGLSAKEVAVGAGGVRGIRVSQYKTAPTPITRVVFDLSGPLQYHLEETGGHIEVHFDGVRPKQQKLVAVPKGEPSVVANEPEAKDEPVAAPKPAPATAAPEKLQPVQEFKPIGQTEPATTQPASAPLTDIGRDVVLFDRSEPASLKPAMQGGGERPSLSTLPSSLFESRTIAGERRRYTGEKISVAFRDADLREVMFFFADVMKMNVILDPEVTGKVDIRLNQVPWDQAFQVILKNQGLQAMEDQNVVRIAKTTRLRQEASDARSLKEAEKQAVDPVTFTRTLSYARVQEALNALQQIKSDRGKIVADIRTNTLIIQDIPDKREEYDGLIDSIDTQTPQVIIEARIIEAFRTFERDLGINWAVAGRATPELGTQTDLQFPHRVEFTADVNTAPTGFPSAGSIGLMLGNVLDSFTLDVALEAFESDGRLRILSSPKVTTQNNQPATIEQGTQIPVVSTTATEIDVQFVPASLRLIVTPQITAEDTVIMKLRVENNQPSTTVSVAEVPGITTESVDTQILVRTGTTTIIGGIYKLNESETETGIPGLRKIPFFGWLFKNRVVKKDSSELLVFITPKIVKNI